MGQTVYHVSTDEIPIILTGEGEPCYLHLPYTQVELGDKSKITRVAGAIFQSSLNLSASTVYLAPWWHLPQTHTQGCHFSRAALNNKCLPPEGPSLEFNATCPLCHQCPKKYLFLMEFWTHLRKQMKPFRPKEEGCRLPTILCPPIHM